MKEKSKMLLLFFLIVSIRLFSQDYNTYGTITDKTSGEHLIGATIYVRQSKVYAVSNSYGFYSINIPNGIAVIHISHVGYKTMIDTINISKDTHLNIELTQDVVRLDEVYVKSEKRTNVTSTETGAQVLNLNTLKRMPAIAGEVDIIKGLQLLPGIQASHEGTTNLSIRGGSHDQNLFLLDDAPVYNPSHALGFFSAFNPDAIKNIKVYKSNMPSKYGGRLSSVIDIHMKEGNNKEQKISGGIGLIASRLTIEAPIKKEKSSFMISGRYSYAGHTVNSLGSIVQNLGLGLNNFSPNNEIYFFDVNAKINTEMNEKNHLYFSTYIGRDHFFYVDIDDSSSMDWGNVIGNLRWNHIFNKRLFSNTMLVYSKYDYSYILKDDTREFKWLADLQELDLKSDFDFYINSSNHLKFGVALENHFYAPGKLKPRNETSITKGFELEHKKALISSVYIGNEQKITNKFKLNYGLRYSSFFLLGASNVNKYDTNFNVISSKKYMSGEIVQFYNGLEPRFSARYLLNHRNSIKTSYTRTKQYQHLISNSTVGLPTDVWLPADSHILPQIADQYSLGYYTNSKNEEYEFFTEVYYKKMNHLIDYKDNADLFLNPNIETQLLSGNGESYGAEFFLEKKIGNLKGWLSYTFSNTTKTIEGINSNNSYPVVYNKKHNISTTLSFSFNERFSISSIFKYTSGGYITIPEGTFNFNGASFNYFSDRNGYQLPAYHRMDFSATLKQKKNKYRKWQGEWNFGIYNVYNRKNLFSLFIKQNNDNLGQNKAYKLYLYGASPYVGYNFKF